MISFFGSHLYKYRSSLHGNGTSIDDFPPLPEATPRPPSPAVNGGPETLPLATSGRRDGGSPNGKVEGYQVSHGNGDTVPGCDAIHPQRSTGKIEAPFHLPVINFSKPSPNHNLYRWYKPLRNGWFYGRCLTRSFRDLGVVSIARPCFPSQWGQGFFTATRGKTFWTAKHSASMRLLRPLPIKNLDYLPRHSICCPISSHLEMRPIQKLINGLLNIPGPQDPNIFQGSWKFSWRVIRI